MCVFSPVCPRVRPMLCISRPKSICFLLFLCFFLFLLLFCQLNILAKGIEF